MPGNDQRMPVRQTNGLVMDAGNTLLAALLAVRVDAAAFQLFRNPGDVGFPKNIARQIQLPHDLQSLHVVRGIRSFR